MALQRIIGLDSSWVTREMRDAGCRKCSTAEHKPARCHRADGAPSQWYHPGHRAAGPPRYDRLKRLVARLSTTGQSIIQTALDRSLSSLERTQTAPPAIPGQRSLFTPAAEPDRPRRPRQDSFPFARPEPTIALTYRASVPMHRWLHRRSHETGQTIQDIIDNALKAARGEG